MRTHGMYRLLRPLLFRLDPERAHALTLRLLRAMGSAPPLRAAVRAALGASGAGGPVEAFGLRFPNRVGLAAGFDKDALGWRGLACLGFGHLEIGTVTPRPQPGNPRPRVFRLAADRSVINRLGFPSDGAAAVLPRLAARRQGGPMIGVNIGKQRETPIERAADDYEMLVERLGPVADYLAVNVSSPNTPGLRDLQRADQLRPMLERLLCRRDELAEGWGRRVPVLVKLSPDLTDSELHTTAGVVAASGIDGIIATNTTLDRRGLASSHAHEQGGLSGAALTERSTAIVARLHSITGGRLPIVACGGVMRPEDARAKIDAGASLVQLYTGLIYGGPALVNRIVAELGS